MKKKKSIKQTRETDDGYYPCACSSYRQHLSIWKKYSCAPIALHYLGFDISRCPTKKEQPGMSWEEVNKIILSQKCNTFSFSRGIGLTISQFRKKYSDGAYMVCIFASRKMRKNKVAHAIAIWDGRAYTNFSRHKIEYVLQIKRSEREIKT